MPLDGFDPPDPRKPRRPRRDPTEVPDFVTAPSLDREPPAEPAPVIVVHRSGASLGDLLLVAIGVGFGAVVVGGLVASFRAGKREGEQSELAAAKASQRPGPTYVIQGYGGAQ